MAFTEATKLEAKQRAHFSCVVCHQPLVEVHHIVPQSDGGSDEIENAAALCAGCHDLLGGNPDKRKQIRQMRDFWYDLCETRFHNSSSLTLARDLEEVKSRQEEQGAMISAIKTLLEEYYSHQSNEIAAASTGSAVASLSGVAIPQPKRTRWLTAPWKRNELDGKRVFAHFVTASGHGYEGQGEIRARENPEGLVAIDLVFTRRKEAYQLVDMLFHISSRQLPHLQKAPSGADVDFEYEGTLMPDVEPP
jgi:HNH endonuclease